MRGLVHESGSAVARVTCRDRWLVVELGAPHDTASWALIGGGLGRARSVAWHQVDGAELPPDVDASTLLRERMARRDLGEAIGLLTARHVDRFVDRTAQVAGAAARCIATVGLGNAVRAGDPPGPLRVGTINLLCMLGAPATSAALLEAMAVAVEARTAAVLDAAIPSRRSAALATGTGTDCVVVVAPCAATTGSERPAIHHAGTHTPIGAAIGQSVYAAIRHGADAWAAEQRKP